MFARYFSLENDNFCRKCLSAVNFQKDKKHTQKIGLCELKTKTCQTFPAPRSPAPSKKYWQKMGKGREARKLLKKNINENQTLSASFLISKGEIKGSLACLSDLLLTLERGWELCWSSPAAACQKASPQPLDLGTSCSADPYPMGLGSWSSF